MGSAKPSRFGAAGLVLLLILPSLPLGALAAVPPAIPESGAPSTLTFAPGANVAYTNISLEREAHVRGAQLTMRGEPIIVPTAYHLNASTTGAGSAMAWTGNTSFDTPSLPPEAYIATPFNATQVANASLPDGMLAMAADAPDFSYQLLIQQVPLIAAIELKVLWSGYALPTTMPTFWNGQVFVYNFTSLEWESAAFYPSSLTGVQDVWFNTSRPANYVKPATGSVAIMIVSESTQTEVFTDFFEVTLVGADWPRPAVDIGNDGSIDWRFDAPGWGAMGRQTTFDDAFRSRVLTFPDGGANLTAPIVLPVGITPDQATMVVRSVPDIHTGLRFGGPLTVGAGGNGSFTVDQLPPSAVGEGSFVRLIGVTTLNETTDANRVARTGNLRVGSDPNGYAAAGQSFNTSALGPLATVSVFVYQVMGNPGPLHLAIQAVNGTGIPTGPPLASVQVPQAAFGNNTWLTFAFGALPIAPGNTLAFVARAPLAPPDTTTDFLELGASVNNSFGDGEAVAYLNVTGLGETWNRPSGTDLLFDVRQDLPTSSGEAAPVTLDTISGTFSQSGSTSNISFTIPTTPLSNGSHTFSISNPNSLALRFNWSASVDYNVIAERLSIKAAGTSVPPWNFTNLTAGAELDLTAAILDGVVAPTPGSATTMRTLTLVVNSTSAGAVELSALDIRYMMDITTPDLAPDFDAALWATPFTTGRADVPVWASSPGACSLEILEAAITYDWPPQYDGIAVNRSDEDVELVTDLYTIFHDDYDPTNLDFHFDVVSGNTLAFVALRGYNLSITPYENLSGDIVVNITATDQGGLSNWSGPLTFTFAPMNDPPRLTTARINVTWGGVQTVDLSPYLVDAESPRSAVTIESATGAPVTVQGQSLVFNFSAGAPDVELLVTLTDGTDTSVWPLLVHPRVSNSVPVLRSIEILNIPSNASYLLDLGPYAYDEEDPLSALTFRVAVDATATSPLYWTVERTASTTYLKLIPHSLGDVITSLTVTDTDGNSNATQLSIHIGPPANTPPRIVAVDPSLSVGAEPVSVFLMTKGADLEDGETPLNWTIENHDPQLFSASIDPATLTLVIEARPGAVGTGALTLTVRDSRGLEETRTISVSVSRAAEASSWSIVALGFFFAAVVLGSAVSVHQSRKRPSPKGGPRHLGKGAAPDASVEVAVVEGASGDEPVSLPELPAEVGQGSEDVGAFMRGETAAPSDTPPGDDERVVTLGLKSDLEGAAAAFTPAVSPLAPKRGPARMAELYLFSLKDGGLLYQVPPAGVPVLTQIDENEFLQWAYDTVRRTEKAPDAARVLEWREWKVVLARGVSFFIAGRAAGEDYDALRKEVKTLVEEVDANFPGTPLDWQRTETLESVSDVLKRLVRGA